VPAHPGADRDADLVGVLVVERELRIGKRSGTFAKRKLAYAIQHTQSRCGKPLLADEGGRRDDMRCEPGL
jgi:hypothetical protein